MIKVNTTIGRWTSSYAVLKEAYDAWDTWLASASVKYKAATGVESQIFFTSPEEGGTEGAWVRRLLRCR